MKLKLKLLILTVLVIVIGTYFFTACKVDPPKIIGCNEVEYKGRTYTMHCRGGVSSYNIGFGGDVDDKKDWFHVECRNGCVYRLTPIDPQVLKPTL